MADSQHMPTKATATDTLGCSLKALSDNEMIVSRTITFHRKASKGGTPGEVVMPESDRGYLIGLSRLGGHRRRIMRPHLAIETEFAENSLYVRRLSDPYRATLAGSFDFTLAEVTPAALTRLAHEIDRPDISELGEVGSEADPVLGGTPRRALLDGPTAGAEIDAVRRSTVDRNRHASPHALRQWAQTRDPPEADVLATAADPDGRASTGRRTHAIDRGTGARLRPVTGGLPQGLPDDLRHLAAPIHREGTHRARLRRNHKFGQNLE